MNNERKGKNVVILLLCVAVVAMGIGFAALGSRLKVTGTTDISTRWNVQITNIEFLDKKENTPGNVTNTVNKVSGTEATFTVGLKEPGEKARFKVTVTNGGNVDAVLKEVNNTTKDTSPAIKYTIEGPTAASNQDLAKGQTDEFIITAEYLASAVGGSAPTDEQLQEVLNLELVYEQAPGK